MDKAALADKLEGVIQELREELEKNEGSTLSAIGTSIKLGYESLKASIMGNEATHKGLEAFKEQVEKFEEAIKKGDRQMSAKALDMMENAIKGMRES